MRICGYPKYRKNPIRFIAALFACMEGFMNVFETVKENGITARQAAEHCGIKINRSGMAVCPFHKDKKTSMKIDRRYYCFGCGEKGDAIDRHKSKRNRHKNKRNRQKKRST